MNRAFSLVELVVVIVIMAIAATVALPIQARAGGERRARLASDRIAADLRRAQQDSWYNASETKVSFVPVEDAYDLVNLGNAGKTERVSIKVAPYRADIVSADFDGSTEMVYRGGEPTVSADGKVRLSIAGTTYETTLETKQEVSVQSVIDVVATALD